MRPVLVALALVACDTASGVRTPSGEPFATLSEWGLFENATTQTPSEGVHPYEVISPLFSDYTSKYRFFWSPPNSLPRVRDNALDLPEGSVIIKTFALPLDLRNPELGERLLETRLLFRRDGAWTPYTYVWNEAGNEANHKVAGAFLDTEWVDLTGETRTGLYAVPSQNECYECHRKVPDTHPLGLKLAQLDRPERDGTGSQLDRLRDDGILTARPEVGERFAAPDDEGASLELRARSYLDANCAHCHSASGDASSKALYFDFQSTGPEDDPKNWGVCKVPTSSGGSTCGHTYDIVPGDSERSIMICRMRSTTGKDQMPPIGRRIAHEEGIDLIGRWIDAMDPSAGCR
jgi:uncharacterized repeat protein (TIGR03806 family)